MRIFKIVFSILLVLSCIHAAIAAEQKVIFTTIGANTWSVPYGVTNIYIDACAAGGGGGGGNKKVGSGAGAGAGGAGQWVMNYALDVAAPQVLTITIPDIGSGGAPSTDGTAGGDLTITGAFSQFPILNGGYPGKGTSNLYIGFGGNGGGKHGLGGLGLQILSAVSGLVNTLPSFFHINGGGGAGGGNGGGLDPFGLHPVVSASDGQPAGSFTSEGPGAGSQAGGGGAASPFGSGGAGGDTSPAASTGGSPPSYGYCGGGGGGGPDDVNGKGGKGGQAFVRIRYLPI